ncbi:DUF1919 domain-containing protein [Proteus mirabilis]|uniref:DUF1919 domain-containing protein n=1 Tax=Proteus mirabilis TaxID=584 RepID=UPI000665D517|nr:DUF1919 domain-containing protein [Proteus mirabilis]
MNRVILFLYRKTLFTFFRFFKKRSYRNKNKEKNITIISSNFIGGCIYNDLGLKFNSPTINLFFEANNYIKFCKNLKYYLNVELIESKNTKTTYPIGILDDIEIHFLHYSNFFEAKKKWDSRKKRVNYEKLFFIMTDRDKCNNTHVTQFLNLPYKNKIFFSSKNININDNSFIYCYKEKGEYISQNFPTFRKYEKYINIIDWINKQ